MIRFILAALAGALLLTAASAEAQYRYTDDKGITKTVQYKLDVPKDYRDAAVWTGPTGIGKPALSQNTEQQQADRLADAQRRIDAANAALAPFLRVEKDEAARAAYNMQRVQESNQERVQAHRESMENAAAQAEKNAQVSRERAAVEAQQSAARALQGIEAQGQRCGMRRC